MAQHEHGKTPQQVAAPTVFLDKSPRVVEYQLNRLSNEQLLLIESADEAKYVPVFQAILSRDGMVAGDRGAALDALVRVQQTSHVQELVQAVLAADKTKKPTQVIQGLARLLVQRSVSELVEQVSALEQLVAGGTSLARIGYAGMLAAGDIDRARQLADQCRDVESLLAAVELLPAKARTSELSELVVSLAKADELAVRRAAMAAMASLPDLDVSMFRLVAGAIRQEELRQTAISTALVFPATSHDAELSSQTLDWLVTWAEATPAEERTSSSFLDAMQLVDRLMPYVPSERAGDYRERLREVAVRMIRIRTVPEEMRYDLPYFVVEAGRPVQVVLVNEDMMPHNLVITRPGTLKAVAEAGLQVGPSGGWQGKQYVPESDDVLHATDMVNAEAEESLTFEAPNEPGEYPYVCTFPRHWMRMYGVMVVVNDLDAWLKQPVEPKDPVGNNRSFVENWSPEDFNELQAGLRGRNAALGEKLFVEASCAQCHRAGKLAAGNVGPALNGILEKWKNEPAEVLREILEPSHRIEPKYTVEIVQTDAGQTLSGLVVEETKETLALLENPEATEPTLIDQQEIIGRRKTGNSMMPKGLLDRFSRDEVLEVLSFVISLPK